MGAANNISKSVLIPPHHQIENLVVVKKLRLKQLLKSVDDKYKLQNM